MLRAAGEYEGEPHRMAFVRSVQGIDFFNDSKGTNVGATAAGIEGLGRRIVLIAGGVGKGQDFEPLVPVIKRHVSAVILIGQDAMLLSQVLAPAEVSCVLARDLAHAVTQAFERAQEGDAIVLSPACASFDMFQNYPHRGQVFVDAVLELALNQGEVV
jgi:UDP-N-acetylmuramoylalanine--D-glutamate ligase